MKKTTLAFLLISHIAVGAFGFALGVYMLPILIAPPSPSAADIEIMSEQKQFTAEFRRDLKDSDALHWGEGTVSLGAEFITLMGELAPGPDYRLYLSAEFVETEIDFNRLKSTMAYVGDVKTFNNFAVSVPPGVDLLKYNSVIVWCETFEQFITAGQYR